MPGDHLRRHRRRGPLLRRRRRCSPRSPASTTSGSTPPTSSARITPRTKAVCAVHYGGYAAAARAAAAALRRARAGADRGRRPQPRARRRSAPSASSAPSGSPAPSASSPTRSSPAARAACSRPTTTSVAELARSRALARDDLGHLGPPPRPRDGYDVVDARLQLPPRRAAGGAAARPGCARLERGHRARRRARRTATASCSPTVDGHRPSPTRTPRSDVSSCYVMPVMLERPELRDPVRKLLSENAQGADQRALSLDQRVHRLREPARSSCRAASWRRARS